ncbi:MAG: hypothetical protein HFH88_00110 [Lachnospiraceae bacterium]|nr:hypothetical protein [Lachnospiraceae bacterium]
MFEFFDNIINLIQVIVQFVGTFVEKFIYMFTLIGSGAIAVVQVYIFLPDIVKAVAAAIVSYAVIVNLLNRGG